MSLQSIGLIFLLLGAGFFLSWGYTGTNANYTLDFIGGAILVIIGVSFLMWNPTKDVTRMIANGTHLLLDENGDLPPSAQTKANIRHIQAEARQATREIKEDARMRIHKMAKELGEMTADTTK